MSLPVNSYPQPRSVAFVLIICMMLIITIGGVVQVSTFPGFLPGIYITEWILILSPPLIFLKRKKIDMKQFLGLKRFNSKHILIGFLAGVGSYFIFIEMLLLIETLLGPYPLEFVEPIMKWFPKTWFEFIPWIIGIAVSAGICEEILFRGFIQNSLEKSWGSIRALLISSILFGAFHLDPWRSPPAILIGLVAGLLLLQTHSLYPAVTLHITTNSIAQLLVFINYSLSTDGVHWFVLIVFSITLIVATIITARP